MNITKTSTAIQVINNKIDKRKNYYLVIDTETANGLDSPLMYDIGGAVVDKCGKVYETFSFILYEIFCGSPELMNTAYYKNKVPNYRKEINAGSRKIVTIWTAKKHIQELCNKYGITAILAHNMPFDYKSTNGTLRFITKSKYRYFLPKGIPVWCTLSMAKSTVCKQKSYRKWCEKNGYIVRGQVRATAEILYKYMTGNNDYTECHTGLEDVLIEKEIFAWCIRQHKKMKKSPYKDRTLSEEEKINRGWEL